MIQFRITLITMRSAENAGNNLSAYYIFFGGLISGLILSERLPEDFGQLHGRVGNNLHGTAQ